jgi:ankyrin repeat protein
MSKEEEVFLCLKSNDLSKLEELLEEGFDINYQFKSGKLVSHGLSEHFEPENMNTLLHFAVLVGTEEMIEFLLEKGVNPSIKVFFFSIKIQKNRFNQMAMELVEAKDENIDFLMVKLQSMYF